MKRKMRIPKTVKKMSNLKIGIIIADADEFKPLKKNALENNAEKYDFLGRESYIYNVNGAEVILILCGIGKVNATAAAMHLVDVHCNVILNYGLSGGISGISRNELCVPNKFLEHDFDLTTIGYKPCEKPGQEYIYEADSALIDLFKTIVPNVKVGTAVSGDRFVCDDVLRNSLKNDFSAMCCDMETAAIAYVCKFAGVPFLALRCISDDAGNDAATLYHEINNADQTAPCEYFLRFLKKIIEDGSL